MYAEILQLKLLKIIYLYLVFIKFESGIQVFHLCIARTLMCISGSSSTMVFSALW